MQTKPSTKDALKFLPPSTSGAFLRNSILNLLRESKERKVVIITSPSGSGKSTLVASYLSREKVPTLWYNLDTSDSDPANFFSSFKAGSSMMPTLRKVCPPPFSYEHIANIEFYTEQYFNAILGALPSTAAIVLDNYQTLPSDSLTHRIIRYLVESIRGKRRLFILSRRTVPLKITDWSVEKKILRLDWGHMKWTPHESREFILAKEGGIPDSVVNEWVTRAGGLIAGLILEGRDADSHPLHDDVQITPEALGLSEKELRLLLPLAELPHVTTSLLKKLCSDPKAVLEILEKLSEKNLFVTGTSDVEGGYYLHDLFREFLKYEAKNHLGKERYSKHLLKVGRALKELDYMEDAINIFSRTGELSEIVEILNTCALTWLHTGRIYTINRCLSILEASAYSNNPWVLYLRATITRFTEPERALKLYEKALHGFKNKRDLQGSKATLSEILNTAQYMGEDFNSVGRFIDQAEKAVQDRTEPLTVADAMLSASLGVMYLINRGVSSKSVEYFKLADRLLEQTEEMSPFRTYTKIYTAIALHSAGECRKAEEYFNEAGKIFKNCPEYPQHRFMFNLFASIHELFSGRFSESVKRINNTLAYARRWKLHHQEEHLLNRKLAGLVSQGLIEEAKETLKEIRSLKHRNSFSRAITEQYVAQMHLIEGNPLFAIKAAECSADLFSKIGASIFASVSRGLRAVALAERGNFKEARKILLENIKRGKKKENLMHVFTSLCYLAYITLKERGKEEAKDVLKEALSLGAERGFMSTHNWYPPMISTLLATAFEYGIEVDYASSLIRFHRIPPPAILVKESDWPWSLRIFTFGKFKMYKGDTLITHQEWRGSMALNLMLALLFYDTVEGIPVSTITDLLWTESDGDRAFQNLEFTLRKLRKIVGHKGNLPLIILKGGKLIINTDLCYVDSIMFQRNSDLSEISYLEGRLDDAIRHGEVAVSTYKGRFLKNHEGYWIKKKQEQLHQQYLQTVKRLLECYREKGDWEKITRLYKKAIAVETSSEYPVSYLLKREAPAGIKKETAKIFKEFTEILNDFTATSFTDKPNR